MNSEVILIVAGEPNSVFSEILFKTLNKVNFKKPIVLICSNELLKLQKKKLNFKKKIKLINYKKLNKFNLDNKSINLINVEYTQKKAFQKISARSSKYIENCFKIAFKLINKEKIIRFINGPVSKKHFLRKKHLGITEYISKKFSIKKTCMLIFNENLSVCPVTTHLPLKLVAKKISKKIIENKIILIQNFYKKYFKKIPKIAVLGLNPHCETILNYNEDEKIINPVVSKMKRKGFKIFGPFPADTIFLKNNRNKYDCILGMYHDQVLTPIKTLFEYDAINITLGLPFLRISPDHGPNEIMMGKNFSNPLSLIQAIKFLDKN